MTAAGAALSYALDILLAQEIFYQQHFGWGFQILLILSTQAMGFGLAGVMRRFLVWPAAMVWPATLIFATVMNTYVICVPYTFPPARVDELLIVLHSLHDHSATDPSATNGWRIGRYKFFIIVAACTFCYEWIPQVIAQFLQIFTFACWIAPNNVLVNQLLGGQTGVGLIPISFDWSVISGFLGSPLQTPAFAISNVGIGIVVMMLGSIGLSFAGPEFYRYLPISENANFDHFGQPYNTSRILNPDFTFNETAYKEYSPLMLGASFSLTYGMSFAALMSTVTHVALFYGKDIWARARSAKYEEADVHLKLMRKYREAPELWFLGVFAVSFAFGMIASQVWATHLAWWAYIVCVLIGVVLILPVGKSRRQKHPSSSLGFFLVIHCVLLTIMTFRCHPSHHQPANRPERHNGTNNWIYATWSSGRDDALQVLGLHDGLQWPELCLGYEDWPLHEGGL